MDIEIFNFKSLKHANTYATKKYDKEHVTPFIRNYDENKKLNILHKEDLSNIRLTLDEIEDFDSLKKIFKYFNPNIFFGWKKIVSSINKKKIKLTNQHIKRNEGASMTVSKKLWKRAKKIIPGGNMFYLKDQNYFIPKNGQLTLKNQVG